jgi:tetratricopeptide (TPR) repeat protein
VQTPGCNISTAPTRATDLWRPHRACYRDRVLRLVFTCVVALALVSPAVAQEREARARTLFMQGREAYEKADYQRAYDSFRESFELSQRPELLYNVASALQGLKRSHDAAETLRTYLRLVPNDPDRPEIERRIVSLEETQRLFDREHGLTRPAEQPKPALVLTPSPDPSLVASARRASEQAATEKRKRRTLIAVVSSIGAVLVVGGAVGLAVGLTATPSMTPYTMGSLGTIPGTR